MDERQQERYEALGQIIAELPAQSSLLDVGCGVGGIIEHLPDLDYLGIDISEEAIKQASQMHANTFVCAEAETFCPSKKYDIILFNESLYYLKNPLEQAVRYMDFLTDEGRLLISVWLPDDAQKAPKGRKRLMWEIIISEAFAQCPIRIHTVKGGGLRWMAVLVGRPVDEDDED